MKILYNPKYENNTLFYPESFWDVLKVKLIHKLLGKKVVRTWNRNPNYFKKVGVHTIEIKAEETEYPDLASC